MLYRGRNKKEFYLASLLYDSIEFRHIRSVKTLLVEKQADPNLVLAKKGISPFHLAIGCESDEFALEATTLILQNGGNPNVKSEDGLTPVHIAAAWGKPHLLRLLLCSGGDPDVRDSNRKTPLHYAAAEGHTECLKLLKDYQLEHITDNTDPNGLVLDKVVVNNGHVVGEYQITEEISSEPHEDHFRALPDSDATEYILKWFDQQQEVISRTPAEIPIMRCDSTPSLECMDSSAAESDGDRSSKRYDPRYITFRKVYRKTRKKSSSQSPKNEDSTHRPDRTFPSPSNEVLEPSSFRQETNSVSKMEEYSKESGIVTIPASFNDGCSMDESRGAKQEPGSDYMTCSQSSINAFERNVFEITEDIGGAQKNNGVCIAPNEVSGSQDVSFVSVSEVYKYIDKEEGVVLYERRLLKSPSEYAESVKSSNISSKQSTLPETLTYDTDSLRKELTQLGFNAGPITATTKRVYLKKLYQLKKTPSPEVVTATPEKRVYSVELEKTLRHADWFNDLTPYKNLEGELSRQFSNPDPSRKWREGVSKSSFTYLLLDPRVTKNLPSRADSMQPQQIWESFLSAIFYVGKGKRSRPYQHLYDAVQLWNSQKAPSGKKLKKIVDIWSDGGGVICLHVFLNTIPVEAYTREAAIISALTLENLTNMKAGEFHGISATWTNRQKKMLGVFLLYKSLMIFLNEGERQLCPTDIS